MIGFFKYTGEKLLKFVVTLLCKATLLATLVSVAMCVVLFFVSFFSGKPIYSALSLAGMICFIYANKQF